LFDCLIRVLDEAGSTPTVKVVRKPESVQLAPSAAYGPLRILVAEDNLVNQKVVRFQLRKLGYDPAIVTNGLEVLGALEATDYDIIFMDCQMPEMGGYEASRRIRERESTLNGERPAAYIVALTADAMEGDRAKCLAAGMDDYISKPTRIEHVSAALSRFRQNVPVAM
jgi:two-component system, sensor histidine kinase and response regulator